MTTQRSTNTFFSSSFVHATAGHHFPRRRLPAFRELVRKRASGPPACWPTLCVVADARGRARMVWGAQQILRGGGGGGGGVLTAWGTTQQYTHHCGAYVGEPLCPRPSSQTKKKAAHTRPRIHRHPPTARRTPVAQLRSSSSESKQESTARVWPPPVNDESQAERERSSDGRHFAWLSCRPISLSPLDT